MDSDAELQAKRIFLPHGEKIKQEAKSENQYPVYYPLYEDIEKYVQELDKRKLASRLAYIVSKQRKATLIKTIEVLDQGFNKKTLNKIKKEYSGSVYEFNTGGQVILSLDKKTAIKITAVQALLKPNARDKFSNLIDGLINRSIDPADAIGDMYIVFEDYAIKSEFLSKIRENHEKLSESKGGCAL